MPETKPRGRILVVSEYISRGGASRVTLALIRCFVDHGFEVALAIASDRLELSNIPSSCNLFRFCLPRIFRKIVREIPRLEYVLLARWYARVLRKVSPTVVFCVTLDERIMRINQELSVPCIEHVHAIHLNSFSRGHGFLRQLASFADHYICSSEYTADELKYGAGVPPEKTAVLYHGVDVGGIQERSRTASREWRRRLQTNENDIVVGGAGMIDYIKGVDHFVRAVDSVRRTVAEKPNVRFVWAGGRDLDHNQYWVGVKNLVAERELEDTIEFIEYLDDTASFLAALDVVVVPSRAESLPLIVLEALALGRPVVAYPVGGVPEVLQRGGGVVTSRNDPVELGHVIAALATDGEWRKRLSIEGMRNAKEHFDASERFEDFVALLEQF